MKITTVQAETKVQFCQLKEFEVFQCGNQIYLKTPMGYNFHKDEINCLNLTNKRYMIFRCDALVIPVKSELIIKQTPDIKDLLICEEDADGEEKWDI